MNYTMNNLERRQYHDHANIVYLSSVIVVSLLLPLIISLGNLMMILTYSAGLLASLIAYLLNRKFNYSLAAAIFITVMAIQSSLEIVSFERYTGFSFYFFNLAGLIIFTSWKGIHKVLAILAMTSLFIASMLYAMNTAPVILLSPEFVAFFLILNIILNIFGVSNSANFYVRITRQAHHQLERAAMTDFLTNLPNRIAFEHFITSDQFHQ